MAGGKIFVAGGCTNSDNVYGCESPSDVVDVLDASGVVGSAKLSVARGWAAGCTVGDKAVFAGGGTGSLDPKSTVGDVIDASTLAVQSDADALTVPRWGLSCLEVGAVAYWGGGKAILPNGGGYLMTSAVDKFGDEGWVAANFNLSYPRESTGAVASHGAALFAGGWEENPISGPGVEPKTQGAVDTVNVFTKDSAFTVHLQSKVYWPGVATGPNGDAYIVDNTHLNRFDGKQITATPLPAAMAGSGSSSFDAGGPVPGAHVPKNGAVAGNNVCFYGWVPNGKMSSVFCYDTVAEKWGPEMPCSVVHRGGSIIALGNSVFVAGGFDATQGNKPTDVVDVFNLGGSVLV